jgi:hypothetical protein
MRKRKWTEQDLREAVRISKSLRQVLAHLGLVEAGGNYDQIKKYVREYSLDISHFLGRGWNRGMSGRYLPQTPLNELLVAGGTFQSYKLKKRLFMEGIKSPKCELCGWAEVSADGRLPLENLRILCPNCHSLQPTHRGRNIKRRGGGTGIRATLKMS